VSSSCATLPSPEQRPRGGRRTPTTLRDLFGIRWALRCNNHQASDTVLGSCWASAGHSASSIGPTQRGVGYLLLEGGEPTQLSWQYLRTATSPHWRNELRSAAR